MKYLTWISSFQSEELEIHSKSINYQEMPKKIYFKNSEGQNIIIKSAGVTGGDTLTLGSIEQEYLKSVRKLAISWYVDIQFLILS